MTSSTVHEDTSVVHVVDVEVTVGYDDFSHITADVIEIDPTPAVIDSTTDGMMPGKDNLTLREMGEHIIVPIVFLFMFITDF